MRSLSENEGNLIIGHVHEGSHIKHVARLLNMRRGTVYDLRRHYQATGSTRVLPRSGLPKIMTPTQEQCVCTTHSCNWFKTALTAANTLDELHRISVNTVSRRHCNVEIHAHCPSCSLSKTCTATHPSTLAVVKSVRPMDTEEMNKCYVQ